MSLKKGTPGKGGKGRVDSFSYTRIAVGFKSVFGAWMAGDPYWALSHEHTEKTPGTKPCLEWMTDGAVPCARCRPHVCPTWIGWVPLYREVDHKAIMVVVHEGAMDLLAGLKYPDHVQVGRIDENSSVFVKRSDNRLSLRTENEQRKRPVDITGDLLTMWAIPALERWLLDQRRGEKPAPLRSDGQPFSPMTAAAAVRFGGDNGNVVGSPELIDAAMARALNTAASKDAETNGKHKPK